METKLDDYEELILQMQRLQLFDSLNRAKESNIETLRKLERDFKLAKIEAGRIDRELSQFTAAGEYAGYPNPAVPYLECNLIHLAEIDKLRKAVDAGVFDSNGITSTELREFNRAWRKVIEALGAPISSVARDKAEVMLAELGITYIKAGTSGKRFFKA